ncbi:MAG: hypothetical protein KAH38_05855, partial [Candidatus Hydrogenedentes bacterium]|nr:hypothetical protein [Candidatus Hydrogenedentota bacterium]
MKNYDGETVLSKFWYVYKANSVKIAYAHYYPDPDGTDLNTWTYRYQNYNDLSSISKINTQYWYDEVTGRALKSKVNGVYYRYEYDNPGDLYPARMYGPGQESDAYKGPMTEYEYDAQGRFSQIKPPRMGPDGIRFVYDEYGQMITQVNASGNAETFEYDSRGNRTSHTDVEGNTTEYVYNALGNVIKIIHPNSTGDPLTCTHYEYETGGCSCSGGSGQLTAITQPGGAQMHLDYDNNGNLVSQTDALGKTTFYEYDSMGQMLKITTAAGREQTYEYDLLGNMISSTDFEDKITKYEYDYRGLMTKTWMENDPVTTVDNDVLVEYVYDDTGRVKMVIDGKGQEINFSYNQQGKVERTTYGEENYYSNDDAVRDIINIYDPYGRLAKTVAKTSYFSPEYDPIEYAYNDASGQLIRKTFTNYDVGLQQDIVRYVDYEYDGEGRLIVADDWASRNVGSSGHQFSYASSGRLNTYTDYDGAELHYTYDNMGRVAAMDAYEGNSYEYEYNLAGQVDTLTAPGGKEWDFSYDEGGRITSYTWPNGMSTHYEYDEDGRLAGIQHREGTIVAEGWAYTLNEGGNIRHIANIADDNSLEAWEYCYYDSRNRLVEALRRGDLSMPDTCITYAYDKADNMTAKIQYDALVYNRFYDTDTYYPWTPISGTWKLVEDGKGAIGYESEEGTKELYARHNEGNHEAWFSFKRVSDFDIADGFRVRLRNIDADNYLDVRWAWGALFVEERVNGVDTAFPFLQEVGDVPDVWYDAYVQLEGTSVVLYAGIRGQESVKIVEAETGVPVETNRIKIIVTGAAEFYFDDLKVMKRQSSDKTMGFTYGPGNQLTRITRGDGVIIDPEYDAWGRTTHLEWNIFGASFTTDYTFWFGD